MAEWLCLEWLGLAAGFRVTPLLETNPNPPRASSPFVGHDDRATPGGRNWSVNARGRPLLMSSALIHRKGQQPDKTEVHIGQDRQARPSPTQGLSRYPLPGE